MNGSVLSLRGSGRTLKADVVVGRNQYGGRVSVVVQVDPHDEAVRVALRPLLDLLSERALSDLNGSMDEATIQARVSEKVAAERERITKVVKASAEHEASKKIRELESQLGMVRRENDRLQRQATEHAAAHLDGSTDEKEG